VTLTLPLSGPPRRAESPQRDDGQRRTDFIAAMANAATGVTVVATDGPAGRKAQTISAMCSVSADPPTVLVAVNRRSPLAGAVATNGVFCVNVLSQQQAHVSDTFAGRHAPRPYDFGCASWTRGVSGAPRLAGAAAAFDCELLRTMAVGTHMLFVGQVVASSVTGRVPLAYHDRGYRRLAAL
jgi:flavin reductase